MGYRNVTSSWVPKALAFGSAPFFVEWREPVISLAGRLTTEIPVICDQRVFAAAGRLASYNTSQEEMRYVRSSNTRRSSAWVGGRFRAKRSLKALTEIAMQVVVMMKK